MKRSIVMVEWTRNCEPSHQSRDEFLWHQMFLSLLYDEVLAQDQTLVCSKKMAGWFHDPESFRLLEETFKCGGLGVLKRPVNRYPDELKDLASTNPVIARQQHVAKFSANNDGTPVQFEASQLEFHNRLAALLASDSNFHREAGNLSDGRNVMAEFAQRLRGVLTDTRYDTWRKSRFGLAPADAESFVPFVDNPELAIARFAEEYPDRPLKFTTNRGNLEFSTAVAVQAAATFRGEPARGFQSLIETVFAEVFCKQEYAEGRYGRHLCDLPIETDVEEIEGASSLNVVRVETVDVRLPVPSANFSEIINRVREKGSGKNLRKAMAVVGAEPTFGRVENAWRQVADDLASTIGLAASKEVRLQTVAVETLRDVSVGVLVGSALSPFFFHSAQDIVSALPETTLTGFVGSLVTSIGVRSAKEIGAELRSQETREILRDSVRFSCVPHPTVLADRTASGRA